ncbi:MAG: HTTM domain-containing protein [Myxococcota bacterium]
MTSRPALSQRLDRWIHGFYPLSLEGLGLYRIFFAGYVLLRFVPSAVWVSKFPKSMYAPAPASFALAFDSFPSVWFLGALDLFLVFSLIALLFGYRTRMTSCFVTIAFLAVNNFRYALGKIDHDILVVLLPLCMAASGWGERYSLDAHQREVPVARAARSWPITAMAALLSFGYFTAGFPKALSWLDFDFDTSGTRGWVLRGFFVNDREHLLLPEMVKLESQLFWEVLDYAGIVFELAFIPLLARPRWWRRYLVIACLFHVANGCMLNIAFAGLVAVYALFFDWDGLARGLSSRVVAVLRCMFTPLGTAAFATFYLAVFLINWGAPGRFGFGVLPLIPSGLPRLLFDIGLQLATALGLTLSIWRWPGSHRTSS